MKRFFGSNLSPNVMCETGALAAAVGSALD